MTERRKKNNNEMGKKTGRKTKLKIVKKKSYWDKGALVLNEYRILDKFLLKYPRLVF